MSGFELLERRVRASAIQSFLLAFFSFVIGVAMVAGTSWSVLTHQKDSLWFMGVMGAFAILGALMMLQDGRSKLPAKQAEIYRIVENEPRRIAWIHLVIGKTNGVRIHLDSGMEHTLPANRKDSEALFTFLHQRAPQALVGYGTDQQKRYQELVKARRATA